MSDYFQFMIGNFSCISLSDGGSNYPIANMFKDVSSARIEQILTEFNLPTTHVYTPYTLLYIDTGSHKVLIDTGVGRYGELSIQAFTEVDNSDMSPGILLANLRKAGVDPITIDTLIITHAHADHIGGNLDKKGDLNFPNAQYFISRDEWDFWFSDEQPEGVPPLFTQIARENLSPIQDIVTFIETDTEIVPGITTISTPGHTPGHISLSISSNDEELVHVVDAVVHPIHLKYPDILLTTDILPEQTITNRRKICEYAASSGGLVFGHHFPPFPNLGHIIKQEQGWRWQPLDDLSQ